MTSYDEEVVGEAVDVGHGFGGYADAGIGEGEDASLGPAAYCAGHVGLGRGGCASGQDEAVVARKGGVEPVDVCFERGDVGGGNASGLVF